MDNKIVMERKWPRVIFFPFPFYCPLYCAFYWSLETNYWCKYSEICILAPNTKKNWTTWFSLGVVDKNPNLEFRLRFLIFTSGVIIGISFGFRSWSSCFFFFFFFLSSSASFFGTIGNWFAISWEMNIGCISLPWIPSWRNCRRRQRWSPQTECRETSLSCSTWRGIPWLGR